MHGCSESTAVARLRVLIQKNLADRQREALTFFVCNEANRPSLSRERERMLSTLKRFGTRVAICGLFSPFAIAQWQITVLAPNGSSFSEVLGGFDGQQVGYAWYDPETVPFASLWSGSSESWVNLSPANATRSWASANSAGQQVGYAVIDGVLHAGTWTGSAESWIDFHPPGSIESYIINTDGVHQVGAVDYHATLWNGTPGSQVDLSPAGFGASFAYGVDAEQQVGFAIIVIAGQLHYHASLWSGTAASFVDLHPTGVTHSYAWNVHKGQQVGFTEGAGTHAALWRGTAASYVDLNPPGSTESAAYGVNDGRQVGHARINNVRRAVLWRGSAATWEDLSVYLPGIWTESRANAVWTHGDWLYVAGHGISNGADVAVLWRRCIVNQPEDFDRDGKIDLSDLAILLSNFGCQSPSQCDGDSDADGDVDLSDLSLLLALFGSDCT